jgi:AcrR family transcriptional regulator
MGRPKLFNREDVLRKALPVFWSRGYADTAVQDLEKATGVNKSGLYSEFKGKEEIFIESLRFYYSNLGAKELLSQEPLGWSNIEKFMKHSAQRSSEQKGCFGVNSMRELEVLPPEARELIVENRVQLKRLFAKNIAAERTKLPPDSIADLLLTYFSGVCIEQNLKISKPAMLEKANDFMTALRGM